MAEEKKVRHILSLSGGKDSTALAILMKDRVQGMEYVFCDTKKELPETYEYLDKLEAFLGKKIVRIADDRGFDHWLKLKSSLRNGTDEDAEQRPFLPSSRIRWCTEYLKIKPFEKYVGNDEIMLYVGIRADENRTAYVSRKPNIKTVLPFIEMDIDLNGVHKLLEESGVGLPTYYSWRTRSGCYFCFFQRRAEWVGLLEHHPDLYELAKQYEKIDPEGGESYTWSQRESLEDLSKPERVAEIKKNTEKAIEREKSRRRVALPLYEVLNDVLEEEDDTDPCFFCQT
jgi:3'-phosphoadenosine 5'-phosphosulfate sulfotransferase (PAPS reductase)/FAD synthetase